LKQESHYFSGGSVKASIVPAKNKAGRAVSIRFLSEETKLLPISPPTGSDQEKVLARIPDHCITQKLPSVPDLCTSGACPKGEKMEPRKGAHRLFSDCFHGVCKWKSAVILHHSEKHKSGRKSGQHSLTKNPGGRLRSSSKNRRIKGQHKYKEYICRILVGYL